jgi:hypothetical protein
LPSTCIVHACRLAAFSHREGPLGMKWIVEPHCKLGYLPLAGNLKDRSPCRQFIKGWSHLIAREVIACLPRFGGAQRQLLPDGPNAPRWDPLRRHPPAAAGSAQPGGPPARVVYLLRDVAHAAAGALADAAAGWGGGAASGGRLGLLEQCARAGCLLPLALEHLAGEVGDGALGVAGAAPRVKRPVGVPCAREGVCVGGESGGGAADLGQGGGGGLERAGLRSYARAGADFLLLRHHFDQWAAAARSGAFQARLDAPVLDSRRTAQAFQRNGPR